MAKHDMYPLHTGYLTKSPPDKRVICNFKRWMKRWFVLWEDKKLEYYEERGDPKPKKTIDLSCCDFLDTNLSAKKFENIFSIRISGKDKIGGRTYYLAAESSYEMTQWVDKICKLCDFKASEKNNTDSTDPVRHTQAPLDRNVTPDTSEATRDSRIIEPESGDPADLVPVKVIKDRPLYSAYDKVPPPRPIPTPSEDPNPCPLDLSSSDSGLSSGNLRSSCGSENTSDYDNPRNSPQYDIPPTHPATVQPDYDVPPRRPQSTGSNSSSEDVYDVPPRPSNHKPEPNYDTLPPASHLFESNYDVPPQAMYDTVPPPIPSAVQASTLPTHKGMSRVPYNNTAGQQYPDQSRPVNTNKVPLGLQFTNYNQLSNNNGTNVYDKVPSRFKEQTSQVTYPNNLPSGDTLCNYDEVPAPVAAHSSNDEFDSSAPFVPRDVKPVMANRPYVNLAFPTDQSPGYKKPLPSPPQQQDPGTELDSDEAVYDIPPIQPTGHPAPCVDRTNKPGMIVAPRVDRCSKPDKIREYVNLPPTRRATVREGQSTARKGGNVQRSKSAVADLETEGYLYMESPKRTESSLRYSKKERKPSFNEEEESQSVEYMYMERNGHDLAYQNYDTPQQVKKEMGRTPLRGQYQDIDIVCRRDGPSVPERSPRTQYTTIDLEKTKGLRKTCEELEKGQ